jgi:hypothetical protein
MFLAAFLLTSCVEEYWPDLEKYENILVVDAIIHDGKGPFEINISRSATLDMPVFNGVANATVIIKCSDGTETVCQQRERGYYFTPENFKCEKGKHYQLYIKTMQGEIYESVLSELPETIEIDHADVAVETQLDPEYYYEKPGAQFYITSKESPLDSAYILWSMTETYEYHSDFKIYYVFDGYLRDMLNRDSLKICYRTMDVPEFYTHSTINQQSSEVINFPLNFVDNESRRLAIKYSLLIKQFSINSDDYSFWSAVEEQNTNQGGLYATQPYQVRGNIHSISNPEEPVIGNFTVASCDSVRIMFEPPSGMDFDYPVCGIDTSAYMEFAEIIFSPPNSWPVYATQDPWGIPVLINQDCMDCTLRGGTLEKPEFW